MCKSVWTILCEPQLADKCFLTLKIFEINFRKVTEILFYASSDPVTLIQKYGRQTLLLLPVGRFCFVPFVCWAPVELLSTQIRLCLYWAASRCSGHPAKEMLTFSETSLNKKKKVKSNDIKKQFLWRTQWFHVAIIMLKP